MGFDSRSLTPHAAYLTPSGLRLWFMLRTLRLTAVSLLFLHLIPPSGGAGNVVGMSKTGAANQGNLVLFTNESKSGTKKKLLEFE